MADGVGGLAAHDRNLEEPDRAWFPSRPPLLWPHQARNRRLLNLVTAPVPSAVRADFRARQCCHGLSAYVEQPGLVVDSEAHKRPIGWCVEPYEEASVVDVG